jgi:glycosyltransferase involved in cell wall biosynthesis
MRIAIATGTFHPESGGPPTYLHRLGRELVGRGHAVRLLSFGEATADRYIHPVTRVTRRLPLAPRLAAYSAHTARLAAWAELLFASDYGLPAALVTRVVARPLVLRVAGDFAWESAVRRGLVPRDTSIDDFQRRAWPGRVGLLQTLQRFYVTRADRVIVPSAYLAGVVQGWGAAAHRVRVVHNAVDFERFGDAPPPPEARARLGLSGRILLSIARLTAWKGVDQLIAALGQLRGHDDVQLVQCGEGPEEERLRALARQVGVQDRVHFRGRVPREEIPLYLRAAELFALYSGYEGLPHVVLEAMAAGVPVLVSDRGGNVEVVEDGVNGRVVPYDDAAALVRALDQLLSDAALGRRLAARAREQVAERYGWPRLVDQTLAVFDEVAAPAASAGPRAGARSAG